METAKSVDKSESLFSDISLLLKNTISYHFVLMKSFVSHTVKSSALPQMKSNADASGFLVGEGGFAFLRKSHGGCDSPPDCR